MAPISNCRTATARLGPLWLMFEPIHGPGRRASDVAPSPDALVGEHAAAGADLNTEHVPDTLPWR